MTTGCRYKVTVNGVEMIVPIDKLFELSNKFPGLKFEKVKNTNRGDTGKRTIQCYIEKDIQPLFIEERYRLKVSDSEMIKIILTNYFKDDPGIVERKYPKMKYKDYKIRSKGFKCILTHTLYHKLMKIHERYGIPKSRIVNIACVYYFDL